VKLVKSIGQKVKRRYVVPVEEREHDKVEKKVFKLRKNNKINNVL
jgi:hypothetical protein